MGSTLNSALARCLLATLAMASCGSVLAQTDEIQVYDAGIAPAGVFALTWHNNFTTSGARAPENPGRVVPNHSLNGVTEWAYGLARWFEAGLYLPLYTVPGLDFAPATRIAFNLSRAWALAAEE